MIWPGMGDPTKRKKTIRFLVLTAIIAISVGATSSIIQGYLSQDDPLKACINDKHTPYKITATLEMIVDGQKVNIFPELNDEQCHRTMYIAADNKTIHAEWEEEYPFEIGHFLWMWDFKLRDMEQSKSVIYVNGKESPYFINHPLQDGYHYKAVFTSKAYDDSKDRDFLPPDR